MCIYIYIYIYIAWTGTAMVRCDVARAARLWCEAGCRVIPVSVKKNTPFLRATVLKSSGRNCFPAPDLVL